MACAAFGVATRTWRHHRQRDTGRLAPRRSRATRLARRAHPAKLSAAEETAVIDVLCSGRFVDVGVAECWATLLDEGVYLCSESTMHRNPVGTLVPVDNTSHDIRLDGQGPAAPKPTEGFRT